MKLRSRERTSGIEGTEAGSISVGEFTELMQEFLASADTGVLRLRNGARSSAIWIVKGQIVHAVSTRAGRQTEGLAALRHIVGAGDGTYFWQAEKLPPARTVRVSMRELLEQFARLEKPSAGHESKSSTDAHRLSELLDEVRRRVPGLESINIARNSHLVASTYTDEADQSRLVSVLGMNHVFQGVYPDRVYIQFGDIQFLSSRQEDEILIIEANSDTSAEAMFWASSFLMRHGLMAKSKELRDI